MSRFRFSALAVLFLLPSCSGTRSTIKDGYAYRMTQTQAKSVVDSVISSNIVSDRMLPGGPLTAEGYDRSNFLGLDTHTYKATAIPVTPLSAYGFELKHNGTFFNGPSKAKRVFAQLNERAVLAGGVKVPVPLNQ